jgi:hypothetical protein
MADLFDVSIGGAGFHLTSHIIALAALFIACFAIAGYISFRSDSIPDRALKNKGDVQGETIRIALPVNAAAHNDVYVVKQPANTMLVSAFFAVTDGYAVAQVISTTIGTTPTGADLMAAANIVAETVAVGGTPTAGLGSNTPTLVTNRYVGAGRTSVERDIYVRLAFPANAVTEAGEIMLQFDFYDDSGVAATPQ